MLVEHMSRSARSARSTFSDEALRALERYRWPGNVRELQNVVEQALWMSNGETCRREHLPPSMPGTGRRDVLPTPRSPPPGGRRPVRRAGHRAATRSGSTSIRCSWRATSRATTCGSWCAAAWRPRAGTIARCCACSGCRRPDYKRFLNFLVAHECNVDFREFRHGTPVPQRAPRAAPRVDGPAGGPAGPDRRSRPPAFLISRRGRAGSPRPGPTPAEVRPLADRPAALWPAGDRRQFVRARGALEATLLRSQKCQTAGGRTWPGRAVATRADRIRAARALAYREISVDISLIAAWPRRDGLLLDARGGDVNLAWHAQAALRYPIARIR